MDNFKFYFILVFYSIPLFLWIGGMAFEAFDRVIGRQSRYEKLEADLKNRFEHEEKELQLKYENLIKTYMKEREQKVNQQIQLLNNIIADRKQSCPTMAKVIADYEYYIANNTAQYLNNKPHPAHTAAKAVEEFGQRNSQLTQKLKETEYQLAFYEELFPCLKQIRLFDVEKGKDKAFSIMRTYIDNFSANTVTKLMLDNISEQTDYVEFAQQLVDLYNKQVDELEKQYKNSYDGSLMQIKQEFEKLSDNIISEYDTFTNELVEMTELSYDESIQGLLDNFNNLSDELIHKYDELIATYKTDIENEMKNERLLLDKLVAEKKQNCPTLAMHFASYEYAIALNVSNYLKEKPHPAYTAAERVKEFASRNRELMLRLKEAEFQLQYYENTFPWLEEFKEIDIQDVEQSLKNIDTNNKDDEYTTLRNWLSPEEYANLSTTEKYQLALDRYKRRSNKTKWEIGIEYERYIGYVFEKDGYNVEYRGALDGLQDMGRDLIAVKGNTKYVIQCKYWSTEKTIHEKHIFQLFGTVVLMQLQDTEHNIIGMFVTSTKLSDTAKQIAKKLNIVLHENIPMSYDYPCIKCNINRSTGEWIYHLPFDQQYDRVVILPNTKEKYALTVAEAEQSGFRRAFKWHGNS